MQSEATDEFWLGLAGMIGREMAQLPYANLIHSLDYPIDEALISAIMRDIPFLHRDVVVAYVRAVRSGLITL